MLHSLNLMVDELARQVKRHRDKLRHRREAHAAARAGGPAPTAQRRAAALDAGPRARTAAALRAGRPRRAIRRLPAGAILGRMPSLLDRALNVGEAKKFKAYQKRVALINAFEPELEHDSDAELRERMDELRERARARRVARRRCCPSASRSCARPASARWGCATSTCS